MSETETEAKQQEIERDSLQRAISELQGALLFSSAKSRPVLEVALRNATGRLGAVETKLKDLTAARETEAKEAMTRAVMLAEQETRLSAQEKKTFAGFMKEAFFTKADFGRLEDFYAKSWDRLSEHGRDEMSHRVWEGVRKGQYTFGELPPAVREKETERAYGAMTKHTDRVDVSKIPETDRQDFIRAYEAGKRDEAEKILERDSFKNNMFRSPDSAARLHTAANVGRESERAAVEEKASARSAKGETARAVEGAKNGARDLSSFGLEGVRLVDAETQSSSAEIPNGRGATNEQGRSTPGS